jgi:hypothetical protein
MKAFVPHMKKIQDLFSKINFAFNNMINKKKKQITRVMLLWLCFYER